MGTRTARTSQLGGGSRNHGCGEPPATPRADSAGQSAAWVGRPMRKRRPQLANPGASGNAVTHDPDSEVQDDDDPWMSDSDPIAAAPGGLLTVAVAVLAAANFANALHGEWAIDDPRSFLLNPDVTGTNGTVGPLTDLLR